MAPDTAPLTTPHIINILYLVVILAMHALLYLLSRSVLVFISYSHHDYKAAMEIHSRLSSAGCVVWEYTEKYKLQSYWGTEWSVEVEKAIDRSDVMVAIVSARSIGSRNARREWAYATDRDKRIVPILIDQSKLPHSLAGLTLGDRDRIGELCR